QQAVEDERLAVGVAAWAEHPREADDRRRDRRRAPRERALAVDLAARVVAPELGRAEGRVLAPRQMRIERVDGAARQVHEALHLALHPEQRLGVARGVGAEVEHGVEPLVRERRERFAPVAVELAHAAAPQPRARAAVEERHRVTALEQAFDRGDADEAGAADEDVHAPSRLATSRNATYAPSYSRRAGVISGCATSRPSAADTSSARPR